MGNNGFGVQTMWPRIGQRPQGTAAKAPACSSRLDSLSGFTFGTHVLVNSFSRSGLPNISSAARSLTPVAFDVILTIQTWIHSAQTFLVRSGNWFGEVLYIIQLNKYTKMTHRVYCRSQYGITQCPITAIAPNFISYLFDTSPSTW